MNFADLAPYFSSEAKAIAFIERLIWPNGPICPHCHATERQGRIEGKSARPGLRKCGVCRKQYTVKVGTIFEDSHIPMTKWLMAIYMMCSSKKGVSASQIQRSLGLSYKSSWFLCHRVREAMKKEPLLSKLGSGGGVVEVDETYVGGDPQNNLRKRRIKFQRGKLPVMALIERGGEARLFPMPDIKFSTMRTFVRLNVDDTAHIVSDGHPAYRKMPPYFASHDWVDHSRREMVRGIIHVNFAESCFSLLKRSILGVHHHVSKQHMGRYLREHEFRWNLRHATDGERTVAAIQGAKGKRLVYREPTHKERAAQLAALSIL